MTINGIEINESTDMREIVLVFNSLLIQAEGLKEELIANFESYQSIDTHSEETLKKYKEVLQSITVTQMKSQDAFEKVAKLDANLVERVSHLQKKIQDENKETYTKIKELLYSLAPLTQELVDESISRMHVDTSGVEAAVKQKLSKFDVRDINDMIDLIDKKSHSLQGINKTFYQNIEHLTQANQALSLQNIHLEETIKEVKSAVAEFKVISKRLGFTRNLALLFTGIVLGVGMASFFKINALSNYYFSQYEEEKARLKASREALEERVLSLKGLLEFLDAHGIYKNTNNSIPYIRLKLNQMSMKESHTFTKDDKQFIGFKK